MKGRILTSQQKCSSLSDWENTDDNYRKKWYGRIKGDKVSLVLTFWALVLLDYKSGDVQQTDGNAGWTRGGYGETCFRVFQKGMMDDSRKGLNKRRWIWKMQAKGRSLWKIRKGIVISAQNVKYNFISENLKIFQSSNSLLLGEATALPGTVSL